MNFNKIFFKYRIQMIIEGVLKTSLFSAMFGAIAVFLTSLVYHLYTKEASFKMLAAIFGIVFAVSFLPRFLVSFLPTKKRVASRIDQTGLQERISTMYAYRNEDSEMIRLQRKDALVHLQTVKPKCITKPLCLREWLAPAISLLMALLMLFLPYDILASKEPEDNTETAHDAMEEKVKELIEQLREEVDKSDAMSEMESEMEQIIDGMEEDLSSSGSSLEQAATMDNAEEQIKEMMEEAISKDEIGEALQKQELTKELGEAISKGDTKAVEDALSELKEKLKADNSLINELANAVSNALQESGIQPQDGLYMALAEFSENLSDTSDWVGVIESVEELLNNDINDAQIGIVMELEKQEALEALMNKLEEIIESAKDEALGNEPDGSQEGEQEGNGEQEGEQQGNGEQEGEQQGNGEQEGEQQGSGEQEGEQQGSGEQEGEQQGNGEQEGEQQGNGSQQGEQLGNGGQQGNQSGGSSGQGESQGQMAGQGTEGGGKGHDMNEGVYDPVSGDVPYGDVYALYFAQYLEALKAGEISDELREIIDAYFAALD